MKSVVTIGRSSSCDIILTDMNVSREHARISISGGKYVFENVGRHGSYMNGRLVGNDKIVVAPGTEILLANRVPLPWQQICTLLPLNGIRVDNVSDGERTSQPSQAQQFNVQPAPLNNYNQPVEEKKSNGMGVAGFVLSLISLALFWVPYLNFFLPILGLVFSFIGVLRKPRGLSIAGLIISGISGAAVAIFYLAIIEATSSSYYYY